MVSGILTATTRQEKRQQSKFIILMEANRMSTATGKKARKKGGTKAAVKSQIRHQKAKRRGTYKEKKK